MNVTKVKLYMYGVETLKPCGKFNSVITLSLLTTFFERCVKIILNFKLQHLLSYEISLGCICINFEIVIKEN